MAMNCYAPGSQPNGQSECSCSFSDIYTTTQLASGLHQVPHLNHLFSSAPNNFSYSREYFEGVAFWSVCLILIYVFLMVHCLFYSCCLCRFVHKSRKGGWEKWNRKPNFCLAIFACVAFLGLTVCAVGIWADVTQNTNLVNFVNVFKSTERLITNLEDDIKNVNINSIETILNDISTEINDLPPNTTDLARYKHEVSSYKNFTVQIGQDFMSLSSKLNQISLGNLNQQMENGVMYRLIATLLLFCITALILISSIIYAIKPLATCTGYVFLAIIMLCFGVWWILGSLAFGADIALADFCISPNPDYFIQQHISMVSNNQVQEESRYLLYCHGCSNPLKNYLTDLNDNFDNINETVLNFVNFTSQFRQSYPDLYQDSLTFYLHILGAFPIIEHILTNDLSCNETSMLYAKAINDGCGEGLLHFTIETGCAILLALVFFVLTTSQCFIACRLTAFFRNKRKIVEELPDYTPVSYYAQIPPETPQYPPSELRSPKFVYEEGRVGYRRSLLGSVSDDRQNLHTDNSQPINYENIQLGEYPPLSPVTETEFGYINEIATDLVEEKTEEDYNARRISRMEENLFMYFPEIAANVSPEGTRHSLHSTQSQP